MKGKNILFILLAFVVMVVVVFIAVYIVTGSMAAKGEVGDDKEMKTVIVPASDRFQTNLKGTRSIISMNVYLEVVEDKKLLETIETRDPEARSKVLDILRDKTWEDVEGTVGKKSLEREILNCYRTLYGQSRIISVYIDDIVTQ
ncbi:MAG: flagellar basal body-associated FliL family protein [Clostridiales bacterium]|jgi:flagellar FliL protein|nr:flagellar basal body-associated FliL family protein [Clostridiales bacterium]HOC09700.1 flagellar basal body-associated FliL family protein [Bacillota bacterium]HQA48673.1 flagellar basal body-associated FliL family protein [Bacillota bacterium]HQD42343.1 flagellar basal body-associated FliL family protein [Bacillota bacterium]